MIKAIGWAALALAVVLLAGFAYRAHAQHVTARTLTIHTPTGIDEGMFVTLGGVDQWVQIRGEDARNPVLLVLHGGPGMSYVPLTPYFRAWEKYFTIVQWDRRGVGKTYARNGTTGTSAITFDRLADDGVELVELLRTHLHTSKVILVGHSVGSVVGVLMALRRPDLFHAYVGTDQIVDMARNERVSYDLLVERVRASADERAKKAVTALEPPPYTHVDRWFEKQKWISATDPVSRSSENALFKVAATAPNFTVRDMMAFGAGLKYSAASLLREMMTLDLRARGTTFQLPVILIEGEHDVLDPTQLAVEYFDTIRAPAKELVIMKGAGHGAMLARSDDFLRELLTRVRPLAVADAGPRLGTDASGQ